ncbi:MAG TPA: hypothetical protein VK766_05620 [Cytophagaceae bacterium]|jgi:hypothetical protein|nr:hypothetical protein [Cytophagaceae bacterium]
MKREIHAKIGVVVMLLVVSWIINFRYQKEPLFIPAPTPQVKKVIVVKKIYIRVPVPMDSIHSDTTTIFPLPKPLASPSIDVKKFRRSRNLYKNGFIS